MFSDMCFVSSAELNVCFGYIILLFPSNHAYHISTLSTNLTNRPRRYFIRVQLQYWSMFYIHIYPAAQTILMHELCKQNSTNLSFVNITIRQIPHL